MFPEMVELVGKPGRQDLRSPYHVQQILKIFMTIIHWGAFQDEGTNCALVKESSAKPPAESDKGKTGN